MLDVRRSTFDVRFDVERPPYLSRSSHPETSQRKVREVFDLGETLLFVVTDRISAFDCILPDPIPDKGAVLNQLSAFWFQRFTFTPNHMIAVQFDLPEELAPFREQLAGVRCSSAKPSRCRWSASCAVIWPARVGRNIRLSGTICGQRLPAGLELGSQLPEPLFTPSTKSDAGHDQNIDWEECCRILGVETAEKVRDASLQIYSAGREHAADCGIIVADTKFEFGTVDGELILIDECLTPDSSRFWPADSWVTGQSPPSYDKQFVRDYLETLDWDKTPPAPSLPAEVIAKTSAKYREAFVRLTGTELAT